MSDVDLNTTFYIPSALSKIRGEETILGPTVIAYLDNFDLATTHKLMSVSIGGTATILTRDIICYTRNGQKYYCYHDILQKALGLNDEDMEAWVDSYGEDVVTSAMEAASEGYYYDNLYMNIN